MTEVIETPNFAEMDIGKLRQYAAHMRLAIPKTAKKEEIVKALEAKLAGKILPEFATPDSKLKPGYARIKLLSDPMPGAMNYPVFLNCNGYLCTIPRDVEVIVPNRVVRTLNDAKVKRLRQTLVSDSNGREVFKESTVEVPSYPFQVLEQVPGPEPLTALELAKMKEMGPKRKYRKLFHRWPRPRELTRAIEQKLISLDDDDMLEAGTEALIGIEETE